MAFGIHEFKCLESVFLKETATKVYAHEMKLLHSTR